MQRPHRTVANRKGNTQGQYSFAQVPSVEMPRSTLNRSCGLKTAFDSGYLIPCFVDEALPGDTLNLRVTSFIRMSTPLWPVMDNMYADYFFFAVPYRLLWDNWQKFNGEQVDPGDSIDYTVPTMTETVASESLSDYMGIPIGVTDLEFNSLHHRAYNLIYNEWFRDENLVDSVVVDTDDGPDTPGDYVLLKRGKRHDYFTSCLPFTQKGTAVTLPLGTTAPLQNVGDGRPSFDGSTSGTNVKISGDGASAILTDSAITGGMSWNTPALEVDLSSATAATINSIREAFQIQKLIERDARGGSRYTEILRSHFGVTSPDQRLQRPEFLGGGSARINVNPVATTAFSAVYYQGTLGGFATSTWDGRAIMKSFTEHCVILGMVNVRADLTYQQGLHRMFSRQSRYDYYWPSFAHLGEQAVLNKEIYAQGSGADDNAFGYQERYAEYRYKPSTVTGKMRSDAASSLDPWHLALDFSSLPVLNDTFIADNPPISCVVAVPSEPEFKADIWFSYKCARPMPTYSVPGLVDHF